MIRIVTLLLLLLVSVPVMADNGPGIDPNGGPCIDPDGSAISATVNQ